MPRRQPHSARIARVVAGLLALASACAPGSAYATGVTLVGLLTETAAPALEAAAPSNDPLVAGRELLNRSLASASTQMQRSGPTGWSACTLTSASIRRSGRAMRWRSTQPCSRASITTARSTCRAASSTTPPARPAVISLRYRGLCTSRTSCWASRAASRTAEGVPALPHRRGARPAYAPDTHEPVRRCSRAPG